MSDKIFGYDFEEILAMQQRKPVRRIKDRDPKPGSALPEDMNSSNEVPE